MHFLQQSIKQSESTQTNVTSIERNVTLAKPLHIDTKHFTSKCYIALGSRSRGASIKLEQFTQTRHLRHRTDWIDIGWLWWCCWAATNSHVAHTIVAVLFSQCVCVSVCVTKWETCPDVRVCTNTLVQRFDNIATCTRPSNGRRFMAKLSTNTSATLRPANCGTTAKLFHMHNSKMVLTQLNNGGTGANSLHQSIVNCSQTHRVSRPHVTSHHHKLSTRPFCMTLEPLVIECVFLRFY